MAVPNQNSAKKSGIYQELEQNLDFFTMGFGKKLTPSQMFIRLVLSCN